MNWRRLARALPVLLLAYLPATRAFYLPGVAPHDYRQGERVDLWVNPITPKIDGHGNHLRSVIPYHYYLDHFHFCQPAGGPESKSASLGAILSGDRLYSSPFNLSMMRNATCEVLCKTDAIPKEDAAFIADRIREHYAYNWLIDGLPAAHVKLDEQTHESFYSVGFALGDTVLPSQTDNEAAKEKQLAKLHNHYTIRIQYHTQDSVNYRVVGVLVQPSSKQTVLDKEGKANCNVEEALVLDETADHPGIVYTYDVQWEESDIPWGTRWDSYLHVFDPNIHWFSLINSAVIVLLLTGMVAMILLRALHKDIARYNVDEEQEDIQEDFGWKLVHGDVFRTPPHAMLLSALVGNGTQLLCMACVTLVFAVLGFLSPSNRGALVTMIVTFYMLFGCVAGYVSARLYKMFGGEEWRKSILVTAFLFPGAVFAVYFFVNFFLIGARSSDAVPIGTLAALFALWFLVSTPLTFVPDQSIYLRPFPAMLMGGVLPFGAIFIELYFIMNSIWYHKIYYVFGFLFLVFVLLAFTCSQVTILICYFHLCA
ncbi:hypothetical protein THASP1DRAFT_31496 [Thamnocephalis sphaerospora]|uniref:Transmembrane 9 superfamily member n=1 Tax=Thamnocephalis sphaerospora TaxID=78915 RepID=A0A4P9XLF5_9FUNG|nr:hypothetical protein THASP1DRAFT_31496 [Thamnocephalis sphaerospora]|eukprot:RKP06697.1 hypothetical protein THASP1DRAFT_31496 [Thamnocephalis sphaerospora]